MIFDPDKAIAEISINIVGKLLEQSRLEVNQEMRVEKLQEVIEMNKQKRLKDEAKIQQEFQKQQQIKEQHKV